jgi:hypothetical protein
MKRINIFLLILLPVFLLAMGCSDDGYEVPTAKNALQNDCIKRTLGPNLIGQPMEFAYAMALPQSLGKLVSAKVEASIAGAAGTFLENRAFYTNGSGVDVPKTIADASATEGGLTTVTFNRDTFAVTLRYYYIVPPEARGQSVNFTFSATDSNGTTVSYQMGPYKISNMDMVLDQPASDNNAMYISIADMAIYNAAQAAANPDKIDLVYLYRVVNASVNGATANVFGHSLVAPAADAMYLPGVTLPTGVNRNTKIIKTLNLWDRQLARLQYGVYIDDVDFETLDINASSNFAINIRNENGVWVETADGQYRAFVYINAVNNTAKTMTVSIKRFKML